ncbi:DUF6713 family protein [Stenotrophomonas maltophilia]|uniref:DUF6713 family protein n=1 Tax=Stenotrophomonas maltophilia TaxID=40324 RepID=UPI001EF93DF6|nr:DUF6713 family protein [Stenotrophomonas maltophilia]
MTAGRALAASSRRACQAASIDYGLHGREHDMERWYLATLLALILHQIDAAFWQEWAMFHVPGGIQGFLLFNLFAVGAVLWGYRQIVLGTSTARSYALACGGLGIGTALIHLAFALFGRSEFHLQLSIAVLLAGFVSGGGLLLKLRPR